MLLQALVPRCDQATHSRKGWRSPKLTTGVSTSLTLALRFLPRDLLFLVFAVGCNQHGDQRHRVQHTEQHRIMEHLSSNFYDLIRCPLQANSPSEMMIINRRLQWPKRIETCVVRNQEHRALELTPLESFRDTLIVRVTTTTSSERLSEHTSLGSRVTEASHARLSDRH